MVESILPKLGKKFVAYGFDASQESYVQVRKKFDKKKNVWIFKRAFCNCNTVDGKIKLYHHDDGLGDSVYRKGTSFEEVKSSKFSDWLLENEVILCDKICLIRMNIEGAEYDVLKDLVECGLYKYIDGYFGMWDDLSKIDRQRDKAFRNFLLKHKIYPITFNGRDLGFSLRIKCIQYEVETCIQSGLRNMARLKKLPF